MGYLDKMNYKKLFDLGEILKKLCYLDIFMGYGYICYGSKILGVFRLFFKLKG